MDFRIVSPITDVETIATGSGIREIGRLRRGGAMAELGGESERDVPKLNFRTGLFALPSSIGTKRRA